jgi:hypothetical protein
MEHPTESKRLTKEHAQAIERAAGFFRDVARRSELPLTETEFDLRVKGFYAQLEKKLGAVILAVQLDELCPQKLFTAWASTRTIGRWRKARANPLPWARLNEQVMIRPSDFFAALKTHGLPKAANK